MKFLAAALLMWQTGFAVAGWQFSSPVEVGGLKYKKVFHHLESSNRKGLAESAGRIALVWEDNREGEPRCWLAVREPAGTTFTPPQAITRGECYEPVVVGMDKGRFVVAWEEDGAVLARISDKGQPLRLSKQAAGQVTLARIDKQSLYAAWVEQAGDFRRVMVARLFDGNSGLRKDYIVPLEDRFPSDEQAYPALAVNADGSVTAVWEDRRFKHTMIMAAHSPDGKTFTLPYRLIDVPQSRARTLGAGMGSMRPTLASCGPSCLAAAWLDKRDFLSGYDVFAAFSQNGGKFFGRNFKVQDNFGDNMAQWHASVTANQSGRVVAVWDDDRDGTSDVWLSDWNGKAFSDDLAVPGASGPGVQAEAIVYLDETATLHIAWLEKAEAGGTSLKYAYATWRE